MQNQLPVIRTYTGVDRPAADAAYRADVETARSAGWVPVAHRWRTEGDQHELAVVFELRQGRSAESTIPAGVGSPAEPEHGGADLPAGTDGAEAPAAVETSAVAEGAGVVQAAEVAGDVDEVAEVAGDEALAEVAGVATVPTPVPASGTSAARAHARATLETIDLHAGGEPIRLIRSGYPRVPFAPILERRRWARDHADWARRALMYEPRGHRDMYGAVLLPPYRADADIAVLFMHNEGYSTMCGHGVIALTTGLIEEGLYPATAPSTTVRWETPAGVVSATADVGTGDDGGPEVRGVRFTNVPAYLHAADIPVEVPGRPAVSVQMAFGGAYYGIVDAADLGLRVVPPESDALARAGAAITEVLREHHLPTHPEDAELGFVYGTIIVDCDPATAPDGRALDATYRNVTVFADAEVDRSPCGSGTSALLAWLHATQRVGTGEDIRNASITGEIFDGRVESTTTLGMNAAVVTSVAGTGYVTGYHTFVVDDRDPLGDGFLLR